MAAKKSSSKKSDAMKPSRGFTDGILWLNTDPVKPAKKVSKKK
jgi:hypothetical protein